MQQREQQTNRGISTAEAATVAAGGALGAAVGSILGPAGSIAGAAAGAVMADRMAERRQTVVQGAAVPGSAVPIRDQMQQFQMQCESLKEQMVAQITQIPDERARTAYQMAINAVNHCVVECRTASGAR